MVNNRAYIPNLVSLAVIGPEICVLTLLHFLQYLSWNFYLSVVKKSNLKMLCFSKKCPCFKLSFWGVCVLLVRLLTTLANCQASIVSLSPLPSAIVSKLLRLTNVSHSYNDTLGAETKAVATPLDSLGCRCRVQVVFERRQARSLCLSLAGGMHRWQFMPQPAECNALSVCQVA